MPRLRGWSVTISSESITTKNVFSETQNLTGNHDKRVRETFESCNEKGKDNYLKSGAEEENFGKDIILRLKWRW